MSNIIQKGNPVLREKAKEVPLEDIQSGKIKDVLKKMSKILAQTEDAVALAAPQIGESVRIFIVKHPSQYRAAEKGGTGVKEEKKEPDLVFINPRIIKSSRKKNLVPEGCLSVFGIQGNIERQEKVTVEAYGENAKKFVRGASGFLAQVFQHEIDHLNGILFTDNARDLEKIPIPDVGDLKASDVK
jgi:peptide deformylase